MFWIARKLRNPKMGLNTQLSSLVQKLTTSKSGGVATCGNTALVSAHEVGPWLGAAQVKLLSL